MQKRETSILYFIGISFMLMIHVFSCNHPFFWDTVLTSTIAQWFYENGIGNGIAPLIWDAGHPTVFQLYLTLFWKTFGKSLYVSHLAMLPFLIIMVVSFIQLLDKFSLSFKSKIFSLLLFLFHPFILTQSFLVSYDIIQVAFMLSAFIAMLNNKRILFSLSILGLCTLSLRGQAISAIYILLGLFYLEGDFKKKLSVSFLTAIPTIAFTVAWHFYHYSETGWMLFSPSESWEGQRNIAGWSQMLKQSIGFIRGFVDYGSVALTTGFLFVILNFRRITTLNKQYKYLLICILSLIFLHLILVITFSNPAGHRYFMGMQVLMIPLIALLIETYKYKTAIYFAIIICFISGHFWIYPKGISNGWDVTLAHKSHFNEKIKLNQYLKDNQININKVSSSFPLFVSEKQAYLTGSDERMKDLSECKIGEEKWIVVSNICNDISDEQLSLIEEKYTPVYQSSTGQVNTILYKLR